jgi:hypothetical protein
MGIRITLTSEQERKLAELARGRGQEPAEFARDVMAAYLNVADPTEPMSFEEILTPIWKGWIERGMTDEELDRLFDQELLEIRSERHRDAGRS